MYFLNASVRVIVSDGVLSLGASAAAPPLPLPFFPPLAARSWDAFSERPSVKKKREQRDYIYEVHLMALKYHHHSISFTYK